MRIGLISLIDNAFRAYELAIIVAVILSWLRISQWDKNWGWLVRFIRSITEPLFVPLRQLLMPLQRRLVIGNAMLDLSPIAALILVSIVRGIVVNIIL